MVYSMKVLLVALLCGVIFGIGLALAGMLNPSKIIGFLNIFGLWDPSLAFVMIGGITVNAAASHCFIKKIEFKQTRFYGGYFKENVDKPLIIGSALFGLGWGLSGLCPGPIVASLAINPGGMSLFMIVLMFGLWSGSRIKAKIT